MNHIRDLLGNIKAAATIAATTTASGLSTVVGWIPEDIGKLASFVGIILTIIMINYWRKNSILKDIEIEHARLSLDADRRTHARRTVDEVNTHGE